ncbi:MAG: TetR/AcrR family transcriptional regulator [Clostridia bacterium]|nr:TetR/AcrR family transcriptional regulator [Clostridia bacterium]
MRNLEKDAIEQAKRRQAFLEHGFALFSSKGIEAIRLQDVAKASGYGIATLYRYFNTKAGFAVAIAEWKWGEFFKENRKRRPSDNFENMTAADMFSFYLESFLEIYRKNKALLRFNQFLNIYIQSEDMDDDALDAYRDLMKPIISFFHEMYERGKHDHTVRTDVSEEEMLSSTIHLMLAAVTRYAVGLVYQHESGFDEIKELETLKELLFMKYAAL